MIYKSDLVTACWPTTIQEYLLKAVLLKDQRASVAWQKWLKAVDFYEDSLGGGSYQLLPLLYKNLQVLNVEDALTGRLKGILRNTWTRNQFLVQQVLPVMKALDNASIRTLLLHKAALTLDTYEDYSVCLLDSFDVFISQSDKVKASALIINTGKWFYSGKTREQKRERSLPAIKTTFHNNHGHHLHIYWQRPLQIPVIYNNDCWNHSTPFRFKNINTRTLNPTEQVLALCLNGLLVNRILTVDWIAHVVYILQNVKPGVNWQRVQSFAQEHHMVFVLRNTLHYLARTFDAEIPKRELDVLDSYPVSPIEKREWRAITNARSGNRFRYQRLRRLWYGFMRTYAMSGWSRINPTVIYRFYRYLRY